MCLYTLRAYIHSNGRYTLEDIYHSKYIINNASQCVRIDKRISVNRLIVNTKIKDLV